MQDVTHKQDFDNRAEVDYVNTHTHAHTHLTNSVFKHRIHQVDGQFNLKGYSNIGFLFVICLPSSRQADRYHSFDCACRNREDTGRARPPLISLLKYWQSVGSASLPKLKSLDKLFNNSKRSCVLVVTCLFFRQRWHPWASPSLIRYLTLMSKKRTLQVTC